MRIVQLAPSLEIGGLERLTVDLALRQKKEGHTPFIYCTSHPGALAAEVEAEGIPVRSFGKTVGFSAKLLYQLARSLRADRADVLHPHNAVILHYGVAAARLAGVPVVINTRHSAPVPTRIPGQTGNVKWDPRLEWIWSHMVHRIDGVVFISQGVRDYFVEKNGISTRNTHIIYNGIDLDKFLDRPANPGANRPRFRFGTVGRLQTAKDHVTLVHAFAKIAPSVPEAELHIMGEGPCRAAITETIEALGLAHCVKLHGAGLDVAGFLSQLDVFVMSSLDEGLPIAIMEAMAAGLPIASTRLPGLTEVAQEDKVALYSPPGDAEGLAKNMLSLFNRQDLPEIGGVARSLAAKFGIAETWHQYEAIFEGVLNRKGRSLGRETAVWENRI
jgi:glycosyltransferase involved in cell wall biosynthesis